MNRKGLTLMEVTIAVAIIAVLATIAVPSYQRTIEQRYWQSSQDILQTTYTGEQVYKSANNAYVALPTGSTDWSKIYMDDPAKGSSIPPVTFVVTVVNTANPPTFTATATRAGTSKSMTINETKKLCRDPAAPPTGDGCGSWPKP